MLFAHGLRSAGGDSITSRFVAGEEAVEAHVTLAGGGELVLGASGPDRRVAVLHGFDDDAAALVQLSDRGLCERHGERSCPTELQ